MECIPCAHSDPQADSLEAAREYYLIILLSVCGLILILMCLHVRGTLTAVRARVRKKMEDMEKKSRKLQGFVVGAENIKIFVALFQILATLEVCIAD